MGSQEVIELGEYYSYSEFSRLPQNKSLASEMYPKY